MDLRTVLAAVLGVGVGLFLLAYPRAVIDAHLAGRTPRDRGGRYGSGSAASHRWHRLVQLLGAASILLGLYFGTTAL